MKCNPEARPLGRVKLPGLVRCQNCGCEVRVNVECHCHAVTHWTVDPADGIAYLESDMPDVVVEIDFGQRTNSDQLAPTLEALP